MSKLETCSLRYQDVFGENGPDTTKAMVYSGIFALYSRIFQILKESDQPINHEFAQPFVEHLLRLIPADALPCSYLYCDSDHEIPMDDLHTGILRRGGSFVLPAKNDNQLDFRLIDNSGFTEYLRQDDELRVLQLLPEAPYQSVSFSDLTHMLVPGVVSQFGGDPRLSGHVYSRHPFGYDYLRKHTNEKNFDIMFVGVCPAVVPEMFSAVHCVKEYMDVVITPDGVHDNFYHHQKFFEQ